MDKLVLLLILVGLFWFSLHLSYGVKVTVYGLVRNYLYYGEVCHFVPNLSRILSLSSVDIMSKAFSASNEMITVWVYFWCVYIVNYIYQFMHIKPSLHHWDEVYLIMLINILRFSWFRFIDILLSIFAFLFIRETCLLFSFFVVFLYRGYQDNCSLTTGIWYCSFFFYFVE